MMGTPHIPSLKCEFIPHAGRKFRPQLGNSPFFDQKGEPAFGTGLARAVIAENLDQLHHNRSRLVDFDKDIQVRSDGESSGAHLSAYKHVKPDSPALFCGNERDILRLIMRAVVQTAGDSDIELARQVRELRVALAPDDDAIQVVHDGRGIKQLMRRQTGQGTPIDVSDVVNAGLERAKVHTLKFFPDRGYAVESESAQLDLLPRGNVKHAVANAARKLGDGAQLIAPHESIGHADAHHELARRRPAVENTDPLQQFLFRRREGFRASLDNLWQMVEDAQAVAVHGGLITFNSVGNGADLAGFHGCSRDRRTLSVSRHNCPCEGSQRALLKRKFRGAWVVSGVMDSTTSFTIRSSFKKSFRDF